MLSDVTPGMFPPQPYSEPHQGFASPSESFRRPPAQAFTGSGKIGGALAQKKAFHLTRQQRLDAPQHRKRHPGVDGVALLGCGKPGQLCGCLAQSV